MGELIDINRGLYDAQRASALSGVPVSTLHYWARHDVIVPSGAKLPHTRLWTWGDLLLLRVVNWLRDDKTEVKRTTMAEVRRALSRMTEMGIQADDAYRLVAVTSAGRVVLQFGDGRPSQRLSGQELLANVIPLVGHYGNSGPDLLKPRPGLRIIPGKLSGEPHVENTRIPTAALFELQRQGFSAEQVLGMFPELSADLFRAAIDLEEQLAAA